MHKVNRRALHDVLKHACKVTTRPGIPALTGVKVDATELGLRLTTTDLETTYRAAVEGTGDGAWSALTPAKSLKDAVGKLKDDTVGLEYDLPEGSRFTVIRDNGARISFRTLPVEDFPSHPMDAQGSALSDPSIEGPSVTINAEDFRRVVGTVLPFVSSDTARPTLQGVGFEASESGEFLAIATDSYRLGVARASAAVTGLPEVSPAYKRPEEYRLSNVIVPGSMLKNAIADLGKASGPVLITFGESLATFELPSGAQWTSRLIEGQFPNWRQLIPEQFDGTLMFDLAEALEAISTAVLITSGPGHEGPMRLELNDHVRITASAPDAGTFEQTLAGTTYAGEDMTVAYNPGYFRECLQATDGAPMRLRDALKPAVFGDLERDGRTVLLMPVRLPAPIG